MSKIKELLDKLGPYAYHDSRGVGMRPCDYDDYLGVTITKDGLRVETGACGYTDMPEIITWDDLELIREELESDHVNRLSLLGEVKKI